ncbi:MAG: hypothetical protein FWE67_10755 [Planctomycetaceae bacterium]|nr:hypothetical protein [Planctomycetaceae bacterium]
MSPFTISVSCAKRTDEVQLGVNSGKTRVCFGNWKYDILLNGVKLLPDGNWEETCSNQDNDCDYLEIELPLTENCTLQRFFLLDHKDKLFLCGDTVMREDELNKPCSLEYETALPLSENLQMLKRSKSGALLFGNQKEKQVCRLFPFFSQTDARVSDEHHFKAVQNGSALFAAFCIDLHPQRFGTDCNWKPLTVGEERQKVSPDGAAAFHFQLGKQDFLLYRSMSAPANRTFFGHNLIDDFCFARFDAKKGVEGLVEVQAED